MDTESSQKEMRVSDDLESGGVVRQNLMVGLAGIVVFMVLAGMGLITPIWSAVLHNVGILFVIFNSARLVGLGGHLHVRPGKKTAAVTKMERVAAREVELVRT